MDKSIERKIAHTVNGHTFPVVELLHTSLTVRAKGKIHRYLYFKVLEPV